MRFVIVSGLSGAGKSVVLHTLEDHHFCCIDNMPLEFLVELTERLLSDKIKLGDQIAVSIDTRNLINQSTDIRLILTRLKNAGFDTKLIFLRASEEVIEHRYNETRRPHPMSVYKNEPLADCIKSEIQLLDEIASCADFHIDTTEMSQYELRNTIAEHIGLRKVPVSILLKSFGYKKGVPTNADYVFDVRCLTNPYWISRLREKPGTDAEIYDFLEQSPKSINLFNDILEFLQKWLPYYGADIRSYFTIAIGCTGGRHRSVYMVEKLYQRLSKEMPKYDINKQHRDM
ncbi:MAG: RNase adapter RapZ [Chromatiales bacterium]|nr:RNase adapter RapZ [Chromatiales bacterium]